MKTGRKFEVRNGWLYLRSERLPVRPIVVSCVLKRAGWTEAEAIPEELAAAMLRLERELSLIELARFLGEAA